MNLWWPDCVSNILIIQTFIPNNKMETKDDYEYKHLRICSKGLQISSCRQCLFEVLCHLEKCKEENKID